jgi:predicted RecB family nuclease
MTKRESKMAQKQKKKVTRKRPPTRRTPQKTVENVQGVGGVTAQRLRKSGFGTIAQLAQADPGILAEKTGLNKPLANKLVSAARNIYKEASAAEQPPAEKKATTEEGLTIKGKIIAEAMKIEEFRRRVVYYIVDNMF